MGVALPIISVLGMGYLNGRAQQKQANAQAAQAEANARMMENNAEMQRRQAIEQDKNNKINEENENRQRRLLLAQQNARIGASGITATGSALNALTDSKEQMELEGAIKSANNRTIVDNMQFKAGEYDNQANIYHDTASSYRAAGKTAMRNSMLGAILQVGAMSSSLYSSNSAANTAANSGYTGTASYNIGGGTMTGTAGYSKNGMSTGIGWSKTF